MPKERNITHTISTEFFKILKPWSDLLVKPEAQDTTLVVPSQNGLYGMAFEIVGGGRGTIGLHERLEPRAMLSSESARRLAEGLARGEVNKSPPQYVEPYIPY